MIMNDIYIIGAGTYGEAIYELATACGYNVIGFFDDDCEKNDKLIMGKPVLGRISNLKSLVDKAFAIAIGDNRTRYKIMTYIRKHGGAVPSLIHPSAYISKSAVIGDGVYIQMGAVIWTKVKIGDGSIISPNTVIAHHTTIGKACLISTLCTVGVSIVVGDFTMFGIGSIAITGIKKVGSNVVLGAGTTVIKDVEDNVLMVGSPARKVRDI